MRIRCASLVALAVSQLFSQPPPASGAKAGQQEVNPKDDLIYVWIPPGKFRVTGRTLSYFSGSKFPVDSVTWDEAQSYCQVTGMRLPTESEWEYAARAGNVANRYGVIDDIAWYGVNSAEHTHDVMQKQPNAWGLYDMLGDVWEWTADWLAAYPDGSLDDPQGPATGKLRVLRGGSWANGPAFVRISTRSGNEPDHRSNVVGFRCAGN
jgi:formylglycine-generating enzyme required for sulfatase activity